MKTEIELQRMTVGALRALAEIGPDHKNTNELLKATDILMCALGRPCSFEPTAQAMIAFVASMKDEEVTSLIDSFEESFNQFKMGQPKKTDQPNRNENQN